MNLNARVQRFHLGFAKASRTTCNGLKYGNSTPRNLAWFGAAFHQECKAIEHTKHILMVDTIIYHPYPSIMPQAWLKIHVKVGDVGILLLSSHDSFEDLRTGVPLAPDIDWEKIAMKFALTGGYIKHLGLTGGGTGGEPGSSAPKMATNHQLTGMPLWARCCWPSPESWLNGKRVTVESFYESKSNQGTW